MRRQRTRVKAQDMKTGEFCYLDELINDGFYPNLKVLPKNYDPPQPIGQSIKLPLEPIFNYSPPNIIDRMRLVFGELLSGFPPTSFGSVTLPTESITMDFPSVTAIGNVGTLGNSPTTTLSGVTSVGSTAYPVDGISIDGVTSVGSIGTLSLTVSSNLTGVTSTGSIGTTTVSVSESLTGVTSTGNVTVPTASGYGAPAYSQGGWGG